APRPAAAISAAALARAAEEGVEEAHPRVAAAAAPATAPVADETNAPPRLEVVPSAPATAGETAETAPSLHESADDEITAGQPPLESGQADAERPEDELPENEITAESVATKESPVFDEEGETEAAASGAAAEEAADAFPGAEEIEEIEEPEEAEEPEVVVDFDRSEEEPDTMVPPPVKRVQVSNQMDILAELDSLRERATMAGPRAAAASQQPDLDIDSLLAGELTKTREIRRKVSHGINSDIFKRTSSLQVAVRLVDSHGDTVHTLQPISLPVKDISSVDVLSLLLTLDLENQK
ncbi:MAG: hypothetical protein GXP47_03765, partial [Acidobacteria bacterium]|nr:hypothetical protein [Acidobacteriota bacterium]